MFTVFTRIPRPGHAWHPAYSAETRAEVVWYEEYAREEGLEVRVEVTGPDAGDEELERSERILTSPDN